MVGSCASFQTQVCQLKTSHRSRPASGDSDSVFWQRLKDILVVLCVAQIHPFALLTTCIWVAYSKTGLGDEVAPFIVGKASWLWFLHQQSSEQWWNFMVLDYVVDKNKRYIPICQISHVDIHVIWSNVSSPMGSLSVFSGRATPPPSVPTRFLRLYYNDLICVLSPGRTMSPFRTGFLSYSTISPASRTLFGL